MRRLFFAIPILLSVAVNSQQNQLLYQAHYLAESNFLNPAVQSTCKWFIGLPVISSMHLNYANSAFSVNQLFDNSSDSTSALLIDRTVRRLGRRTFIGTEFHFVWLALGFKHNDYYYTFSLTEKNNIPVTISKDVFSLPWKGNSPFEGETATSRGTSVYANHYREYAFGISKRMRPGDYIGLKGKLLFGKLNASMPLADIGLYTHPANFRLTFSGEARANISAPVIIDADEGRLNNIAFDENTDLVALFFNRKNWGLAFDAGFIHQYNSRTSVSGSIVDLGFINWRTNLNNLQSTEDIYYEGFLVDTMAILESILDSFTVNLSSDPYFTMLPLKLYLGADHSLTDKINVRVLGSAVVYRTKLLTALTLAADYNPFGRFHVIAGYSLMYRAFNNFGLGFSISGGPLQFYAITDNAIGMIWPLTARNLNIRFGLNLNFGCNEKENTEKYRSTHMDYCPVYRDTLNKNRRWKR